jgi:hypothetical protein
MSVFTIKINPVTGKSEWELQNEDYDYHQEIARSAFADMLHDTERVRHTLCSKFWNGDYKYRKDNRGIERKVVYDDLRTSQNSVWVILLFSDLEIQKCNSMGK